MDVPVKDLPEDQMDKILYGSDGEKILFRYENDFGQVHEGYIQFEGVFEILNVVIKKQASDYIREQMEKYMAEHPVQAVKEIRLKKESLSCAN